MNDDLDSYLKEEYNNEIVNTSYKPVPDKIYKYSGLEYLNTDASLMQYNPTTKQIFILPYHINKNCKEPFLEFAVIKTFELESGLESGLELEKGLKGEKEKEEFHFISIPKDSLLDVADSCELLAASFVSNYCEEENVTFSGFLNDNEYLYIFYNLDIKHNYSNGLFKSTPVWFLTVDEILNKHTCCNIQVNEHVSDFFMNFIDLTILKDETDSVIESPVILYTGTHFKSLKMDSIFCRAKIDNGIFGKHFYFTDYKNAVKEGGWSKTNTHEEVFGKRITESDNGKYMSGGVIRYAVFSGNIKICFNHISDEVDSDADDPLIERISDSCGNWSNEYDSVFVGRPTLDNGTIFENGPLLAIKEYGHFLPLSYHTLNKKALGETWNRYNNDYSIA